MVIEEKKVLTLEDKTRHLLIKKLRLDGDAYMICLRVSGDLLFEVFKFENDALTLVTSPSKVSKILDAYVNTPEFKAENERLDNEISKYIDISTLDFGDKPAPKTANKTTK